MRLLLFGELGLGTLARSFESGLATEATVARQRSLLLAVRPVAAPRSAAARLGRRLHHRARVAQAGPALVETVEQLRPDAVLVVKGRGIDADSIARVRQLRRARRALLPRQPGLGLLRYARRRGTARGQHPGRGLVGAARRPARGGRRAHPGAPVRVRLALVGADAARRRPSRHRVPGTMVAPAWNDISPRSRDSRSRCGERDGSDTCVPAGPPRVRAREPAHCSPAP